MHVYLVLAHYEFYKDKIIAGYFELNNANDHANSVKPHYDSNNRWIVCATVLDIEIK